MNQNEEIRRSKARQLEEILERITAEDCMVAFSGGVDSALLLRMTCEAAAANQNKVYAVTMQTRLHPVGEITHARKVAEEIGAEHRVLVVDELQEAGIADNPLDRCYRCKAHLFRRMEELAEALHVSHILEGTNADDQQAYRPGLRAIREQGIHSPLLEAGLTKKDVRSLAEHYGLSVSDRPAMPCLATRFPYGTPLSYEAMQRVERGEEYVRGFGFYNVRLRVHDNLVRIEVDPEELQRILIYREQIIGYLKELGYDYVTIDMEGFRSGSMDLHV